MVIKIAHMAKHIIFNEEIDFFGTMVAELDEGMLKGFYKDGGLMRINEYQTTLTFMLEKEIIIIPASAILYGRYEVIESKSPSTISGIGQDTKGKRSIFHTYENCVFPRIEAINLSLLLRDDGYYEINGIVRNTDDGCQVEPHEINIHWRAFEGDVGANPNAPICWTSPTYNYRVEIYSEETIHQTGHSETLKTVFNRIGSTGYQATKVD